MFHDMGFGFMGIGWLLWLGALGFILYVIIKFSKPKQFENTSSNNKESALDILKMRYANGEISEKEFDKIKKTIVEN
jgi:putative membrane protein